MRLGGGGNPVVPSSGLLEPGLNTRRICYYALVVSQARKSFHNGNKLKIVPNSVLVPP